MRINKLILSLLLLAGAVLPNLARAADSTTVHAILIMASNEKAPADPRLAAYEAELQRNVPESSFRLLGEGSASVGGSGRAKISLGRSHRLEIESEKSGGEVRLKVQWLDGNRIILTTTLANLQPGVPAMLGRRSSGDGEVPIVLVIAK
jgi:hypothetical protein